MQPTAHHAEVIEAYRAYPRAMADGDTDTLDELLDGGFTLTHITGYVQATTEWLAQMRAGRFVYHNVEEQDTAWLVGRIATDATVHGAHADWRLRLTIDYARQGGMWTALRAVATTW
ncbi:nuclear transport factor 2 family protein [Streptomyces sp. NPDC101166]|uniref:nuclear transport factor 2 family protein n=1 Tax=Streptomyces sp. NPDC101166 TaxID=3366120 RepID=UPI0038223EED